MYTNLLLPVVNSRMLSLKDRIYSFPCTERCVIQQSRKCGERSIDLIALPSLNSQGSGNLARVLCLSDSASSSGVTA